MAKSVVVIFLSLMLINCANTPVSNNLPLNFIDTEVAIISSETGKVRYNMRYKLSKSSPKTLYGKVQYQDLINRKEFHTTLLGRVSQTSIINYNSMPSNQINNQQFYNMTLILYADADYRNIIGSHQEIIWFDMPKNVAQLLKIKLL